VKENPQNLSIRDAHAHFFGRSFFQTLGKQMDAPAEEQSPEAITAKLGWELPPADNTELASRWVQELDKHGVEQIALMASLPGDEASVADAMRAYPDRIYGYFMLNPAAPDGLQRARNAVEKLGLQGICLFPAMHRYSVHDECVRAVCELAAGRKGMVVFVHMGVLTVGIRKKLGLASKFDMSRSNPIDLHRVALEHPKVNFVIPHFGAGFFREVLMLGDLCPNVYLDTSSSNSWVKYQTPGIGLKDVFAKALEIFGPKRILFGSDSSFFPRGWNAAIFEAQLPLLRELGVNDDDLRAILGGNLQGLLAA
jgi:predicted TIM-barrel fold metal-dependent hydrolase